MTRIPPPSGAPDPDESAPGHDPPPSFHGPAAGGSDLSGEDPLVPPPYDGLRPLWRRFRTLLRQCGWQITWIFALTFAVPQIVQAWFVATTLDGLVTAGGGLVVPEEGGAAGEFVFPSAGVFLWLVGIYVVTALVASVGWGAGIWAVTQSAAGLPVRVPEALLAGLRRVLPMFGWYVIYTLLIVLGMFLCVFPGVYAMVGGALFSFVVIYERDRTPLFRSFSLVHSAILPVLARVALLGAFMIVVFLVVGLCVGAVVGPGEVTGGARLASDVVLSLVLVPVYTVLLLGLLLTYTQVRARQEDISTVTLWQAANEGFDDASPPPHSGPFEAS